MSFDQTQLPRSNRDVIYRRMPNGGVLFTSGEQVYYGLNRVAADVWEALPPVTTTLDVLCARVHVRYPDVDESLLRADVVALLTQLLEFGLVSQEPEVASTRAE